MSAKGKLLITAAACFGLPVFLVLVQIAAVAAELYLGIGAP